MMQFIRDRAQGWFAALLLGFLCIPFGLWGVQSYLDAGKAVDVAEVDGDAIGLAEFRQAYERVRAALEAQLGEQAAAVDPAMQKREVLDQLVRARLVRHYAQAQGLRISDPMVAAEVTRIPAFQADGLFSPELYADRLRYTGLSRRGFEEQLREELAYNQFRQGITSGSLATEAEIDGLARLRGERRDIDFVQLGVDEFARRIEPGEEQLRAWFEAHREGYRGEPSASIEYVTLAADDFASDATPEPGVLESLYEENRSRFEEVEERRVRHILVEVARDADSAAVDAARSEAEAIRQRISAGEDFAKVAEASSDDPGTARSGGDLGFFARGVMDADFEAAAFSLPKGELSQPVRSAYGFHVLEVQDIKPGKVRTLEEVRPELLAEWRREQGERRYFQELERLETLAFESGDNLHALADALGLEVQSNTDFRASTAKGALTSNAVIQRAFDPEFAASGLLSEPIEVGTDRVVVLKVIESRPASPLSFEEARERVIEDFRLAEARTRVNARGTELRAAVEAGSTLGDAVVEGEAVQHLEGVTRAHPELPRAASRLAFRVPAAKVEKEGPQAVTTTTGAGNFIIAVVSGVRAPSEVTDELRAVIDRDSWVRARQAAEIDHVEAELRRRAAIEVREDAL